MDDFETLMKKLQQQAICDASAIDPAFGEKIEASRKEIEEHEKRLEDQRNSQKAQEPPKEYKDLWEKLKPQ